MAREKYLAEPVPVVVAAHGGSSATTVARALRLPERRLDEVSATDLVVLTALGHAYGGRRLVESVAALPESTPIVLALTSTGWWLSAQARASRRLVGDRLTADVVFPWCYRWHDLSTPSAATATSAWRSAALELATVLDHLTSKELSDESAAHRDPVDVAGTGRRSH